jgi:hypothetical protein
VQQLVARKQNKEVRRGFWQPFRRIKYHYRPISSCSSAPPLSPEGGQLLVLSSCPRSHRLSKLRLLTVQTVNTPRLRASVRAWSRLRRTRQPLDGTAFSMKQSSLSLSAVRAPMMDSRATSGWRAAALAGSAGRGTRVSLRAAFAH